MSQSGFTPIQLYRSSTAAAAPLAADLVAGELAINTTDEKLYFENASGVVKLLASSAAAGGTFTTVVNGLGAVGTPSYTFTGDLNTGMWSPAADTIAFSEGGAEAMRISSSGFVGIGTTGPTTLLDVRGAAVGANVSAISIDNTSAGSGSPANTVSLNFSNAGSVKASITGAVYGDGYMAFATNTNTERMRLTAAGDVGIGTTVPASKLDVTGVDNADSAIGSFYSLNRTASLTIGYTSIVASSNSGGLNLRASGANPIVLATNATERMRLDASGNVGIGTSAPDVKLRIDAASPTRGIVETVRGTGSTGSQICISQDGVGDWAFGQPAAANALAFFSGRSPGADGTERMRISSAGLVGIGTNAPSYALDVSATGNISGQFKTSGSINALYLADAGTTAGTLYVGTVGNDFRVVTGSNENVRVTSAGLVGIGTSAPTRRLSISGGDVELNANVLYLNSGNAYIQGNSTNILFSTNANERMRLDASGNLLVGTTSDAGVATNTAKIIGGVHATVRSSLSVASGVATTIVTLPSGDGIYIVSTALSASTDPANYNETAIVSISGSTSSIAILVNASVVSLTMSGLNLQVTQNQGATQTMQFSVLRIL